PILPQPPGIGRNISGSSSTNAACCSGVSIRLPYPCFTEASVAKILPPTRKSAAPMCEPSSAPSRLSAIRRKSAAFINLLMTHPRLFPVVVDLLRDFLHGTRKFCRRVYFKARSVQGLSHILNDIGELTAQQPGWHVLEIEKLRPLSSSRWKKLLRRLIEKASMRTKENHCIGRLRVSDLLIG